MTRALQGPILDLELQLRGTLAARLGAEAKRRRTTPEVLLADLIETVIGDDLFNAVLDTDPLPSRRRTQ